MAEKVFLIQMYGPKQLMISWRLGWKDVKVKVGEELIGIIEKRKDLTKGKTFTLRDGSTLKIFLDQTLSSAGLAVLHNGKPLHGSAADPVTRYQAAYGALYLVGAINVIGGSLAYFLNLDFLQSFGFSYISIISGAGLFLLGYFVKRGSKTALLTGIALYFVDGIGASLISYMGYQKINLLSILTHLVFLILMFQGISGIKEITGNANSEKEQ